MITRIKINGFKSLVDTELYFSPFTCIAGANAVGKSNFFDALLFLSNLADKTIVESAKSVRSEKEKHANIKDVFFKNGEDYLTEMSFEVDMLIPKEAIDDLGQRAEATITSLRYSLILRLNLETEDQQPIEIVKETLEPISLGNMKNTIFFTHRKEWIGSVLSGRRSTKNPFISTGAGKIKLHQDGGNKGRTAEFTAKAMPRSLLSTVTAESPTAFLVRQEMRNWIMLQFEPNALRAPNQIAEVKNAKIQSNGLNLPATLYRLQKDNPDRDVCQQLTNSLKDLVEDVDEIYVDKDEKRDLLTLNIRFRGNFSLPARSLSDGTLRFLGLTIIEEDKSTSGLICLEEPENGINPKKIPQIVELLTDMATDTTCKVDDENPLRQVIINTHSPLVVQVVQMLSDESLYLAKNEEIYSEQLKRKINRTIFCALGDTWKATKANAATIRKGEILSYLGNSIHQLNNSSQEPKEDDKSPEKNQKQRTVAENFEQPKLF